MRALFLFLIFVCVGAANTDVAAQTAPTNTNQSALQSEHSSAHPPLALPPPRDINQADATNRPVGGIGSMINTLGALVLVVGIFLLVAWLMKRSAGVANNSNTNEVVQVIAKTQLGGGQSANVIRFGNQLVLVAQSANQSQTLATITDSDEVERLCTLCSTETATAPDGATALSNVISSFMNRSPQEPESSTVGGSA